MANEFDGLADIVDDSTSVTTLEHIYKTNYDQTWKKHMCLQRSGWCWRQALHRPDEAIKYILGYYD